MKTNLLITSGVGLLAIVAVACAQLKTDFRPVDEPGGKRSTLQGSPARKDKVVLTTTEWQKRLTPAQYKILRNHGTEAAFCGRFHDHKGKGVYKCAGCQLPVFASDAKFDSGTGWPSFFQPVNVNNIWTRKDRSLGMVRDEVLCARCDGHFGHVFTDGPASMGGLRYCINSDALVFEPTK
ncbi:MAG: peptide-methionine (R)-S-oxide reductase MsrB [Fimbriimonadaceae bacterium]|nr:peptide-methionine (R)-S-oxide reductase MsrB [Fimbriimonadaceae bacterium]